MQFMNGQLAYVFLLPFSTTYSMPVRVRSAAASFTSFFFLLSPCITFYIKSYYVLHRLESVNVCCLSLHIKKNEKNPALAGFVLSIFRTKVQTGNQYTTGSKDFGAKLNEIDSSLNIKKFLKLWSQPVTVHCVSYY